MYKLIAKSALMPSQIEAKHIIGCDGLEIQLLGELRGPNGKHHWLNASDVFQLDDLIGKNVFSIHTPIIDGNDPLLESLMHEDDFKLLEQVFYIANYVGEQEQRNINIVIHSESSLSSLVMTNIWKNIVTNVTMLLSKYTHTILCIENVSPCRNILNTKVPIFNNNFYEDNVDMCKELIRETGFDRIGVVLDTCHQGMTESYINHVYKLFSEATMPDFSIEHYIKLYAPYLKIIHLADFRNNGFGKDHGIPFENIDKFNHIMDLICKYVSEDCLLTLEVRDSDYVTCENYKKQKQLVDDYFRHVSK